MFRLNSIQKICIVIKRNLLISRLPKPLKNWCVDVVPRPSRTLSPVSSTPRVARRHVEARVEGRRCVRLHFPFLCLKVKLPKIYYDGLRGTIET